MLKFCYQGAATNCVLLSAFCLLDIKENWIESFHLLDEKSKVIEHWKEKEQGLVDTEAQLQWPAILTAPTIRNYWSHYNRNSWEAAAGMLEWT